MVFSIRADSRCLPPSAIGSRHDFQYCRSCVEKISDLVFRHWRFAWSVSCKACGQARAAQHPAEAISDRLLARAARGAVALKTAVATNNLWRLRRVDLTLDVMSVLGIGHLTAITSGIESERLMALSAVDVGMTRPLLTAAITLRRNDRVVRELRRVFPRHRQVIERIRGLPQDVDRRIPERSETGHPTGQETHGMSCSSASESALQAARPAISEFGPDASRQAPLERADAVLRRSSDVKS